MSDGAGGPPPTASRRLIGELRVIDGPDTGRMFALGEETVDNGALWFVPKSHTMNFGADRFDAAKFFRAERSDNAKIIRAAVSPRLAPGDAAFFHCNTLHSAGKNSSAAVKFSLVFTYHGRSNAPKAGSRSASKPEIELGAVHAVQ